MNESTVDTPDVWVNSVLGLAETGLSNPTTGIHTHMSLLTGTVTGLFILLLLLGDQGHITKQSSVPVSINRLEQKKNRNVFR